VLSSHSNISPSRTVRPCSPRGGRRIGHWRTTWSSVCSSTPHSQAAEEAIPHLYRQERKRPKPVRRRLRRTQALLGKFTPKGWVPVSWMKLRSLAGLSAHSAFHWWSTQCAARMLSDEMMSCYAVGANWCLDLRRRASALVGRVNAEWSRGHSPLNSTMVSFRQCSCGSRKHSNAFYCSALFLCTIATYFFQR